MKNNYLTIKVEGKNPSLFINRLITNQIHFKNFKRINYKTILLDVKNDEYDLILNMKTIYKISIIKYGGINKYTNWAKSNLVFLICFFVSIVFILIISNICFEIEIIHDNNKIRKLIKDELDDNNIKVLRFIPSFKKRKIIIEKIISENKDDIEWLEIEKKGCKLIVKLTERKQKNKTDDTSIRDIVASKNGIIKKVESSSGVILKGKNDYVKKGDTIITGNIIKDDVIKGQVRANGKVYAETWYKVTVKYPLYYTEIRYLDEVKNNLYIKIFNKEKTIFNNYDNTSVENKIVLYNNDLLPINITIQKARKIKKVKEKLTIKKAYDKAVKLAVKKINSKLDEDEYIISKNTLNFNLTSSKIYIDVFFKVYENITSYQRIEENNINTE